jgi:hypothetical protein
MEILNLEYNKKKLILKALNNSRTKRLAYVRLGITEKCLYNYIKIYNIKLNKNTHAYEEDIPRGSTTIKI